MSKEQRSDVHQHITDQIVAAIERGAAEFRLPGALPGGGIVRPVNVASRKRYRGVNVVAFCAAAEETGYASGP
jgi:antirestriction protein ArdC